MTADARRRWALIAVAAFAAFLMEYSIRGAHALLRDIPLAAVIYVNYFTYLAVIEHLIGRYRLNDVQVWLTAQFFGLSWQLISVSAVYLPPYVWGIGLYDLLINNLVWWTTIQTVFGLYMARRVVGPVDRAQDLLSRAGVWLMVALYLGISASFRLFVAMPVTLWQFGVMLSLTLLFGYVFYRILTVPGRRARAHVPFERSVFLDGLAVFTVVYLIVSLLFVARGTATETHLINIRALRLNLVISPLIALALVFHRLRARRSIPL